MPQEEASIRMTVDSSQALQETQRYTRAATETFNILLEKSRQYAGNLQERIQFMQREIELMRESRRIATEATIERLQSDERLSPAQRTRLTREVKAEEREDIRELKELNKVFRQWSAEQRQASQQASRLMEGVSRILPSVVSAQDVGGLVSGSTGGLLAGLGVLGVTAGIALTKEIRGAAAVSSAIRDYAILRGRSMMGVIPDVAATKDMGLGALGLTPSQYFQNYAQLYRSGAGVVNENMLNIMSAERALGLSRQTTGGLLGVERYGAGQITPILSYFETYLRNTNQSIAVLPEILQTFVAEATTMIRTTGRVDSASLAASISAVGRAFGLTGEPLNIVYGALRQGMQQSNNPAIQALQFQAMERAMPGASLWQMQMAMENPMRNPQYIINMLEQMKMMTGGGEMYARALFNVFGQYGITATLADQLSRGKLTPELFLQQLGQPQDYRARAESVVSATEEVTAKWMGMWERSGFVNIQKTADTLESILKFFEDQRQEEREQRDKIYNAVEIMNKEAAESNKLLSKIINKIATASLYQGVSSYTQ